MTTNDEIPVQTPQPLEAVVREVEHWSAVPDLAMTGERLTSLNTDKCGEYELILGINAAGSMFYDQ